MNLKVLCLYNHSDVKVFSFIDMKVIGIFFIVVFGGSDNVHRTREMDEAALNLSK